MRGFEFNKLGGWPLSQDKLDWMQAGYQNPLKALAEMGGTVPHIISGMVLVAGVVSDGWLYYNGEMIPFVGGALPADPVDQIIKITTYKTTLVYGDGNSYDTQYRKEAAFGTGVVQFNYSDLKIFHEEFGKRSRSAWITLTGSDSSSIQYLHNKLTQTVHIVGSFRHSQAVWAGGGGIPEMKGLLALPAAISPAQTIYFTALIETHHVTPIYTDNGDLFVSEICRIDGGSGGYLAHTARTLAPGTSSPMMNFSISYQL